MFSRGSRYPSSSPFRPVSTAPGTYCLTRDDVSSGSHTSFTRILFVLKSICYNIKREKKKACIIHLKYKASGRSSSHRETSKTGQHFSGNFYRHLQCPWFCHACEKYLRLRIMPLANTAKPRTQKLNSKEKQLYIKAVVRHSGTTEYVEIATHLTLVPFWLRRRLQSHFSYMLRAFKIGFQRKATCYPKQDIFGSFKSLLKGTVKISITLYRNSTEMQILQENTSSFSQKD